MHHYHNLLYISHAATDESEGLKQALSLARNNEAPLNVLVMAPSFPRQFADYQERYEESLLEQARAAIQSVQSALKMPHDAVEISLDVLHDQTPSVAIIQRVIRDGHDLVIKEAQASGDGKGFKALDMDLLRKCPCAVWLCRPIAHSREHIQVAVAIDPEAQEPAAAHLSGRMLQLARSLADSCSQDLHIISCWEYAFESYLHGNAWMRVSDTEIAGIVHGAEREHRAMLEQLVQESGIAGNHFIYHLRGKPEEQIPAFVARHHIDILVMGTVARTGIPGFMIGNTAENIVQQLTCSLLALKPQGFVSPVKAFTE